METRGCIAEPDRGRKQLFMWGPVHTHDCQRLIAQVLGLPLADLRMKHVDIGGNFGVKGGVFPEYIMVGWAAMRLGRPVKWTEDRLEHMVANAHAREQVHEMSAAFDADGVLLALRDEIWHNHGAFIRQAEPLVSDITVGQRHHCRDGPRSLPGAGVRRAPARSGVEQDSFVRIPCPRQV